MVRVASQRTLAATQSIQSGACPKPTELFIVQRMNERNRLDASVWLMKLRGNRFARSKACESDQAYACAFANLVVISGVGER